MHGDERCGKDFSHDNDKLYARLHAIERQDER